MAEAVAVKAQAQKFSWGDFFKIVAGVLVVGVGFSMEKEQLVSAAIVTFIVWLFNVYMKKTGKKMGRGWLSLFVLVLSIILAYFNHPPEVIVPTFPVWVADNLVANVTAIINYLAGLVIGSASIFAYATLIYNAVLTKVNQALGLS